MLKYNGNRREQPPPLGPEEQELMEAGRRALVGWKRWGGCPAGAHTPKLVKQVDYGSVGRKLETGNNCPVGAGRGGVLSGHSKAPQTRWLKATGMYSLSALEATV